MEPREVFTPYRVEGDIYIIYIYLYVLVSLPAPLLGPATEASGSSPLRAGAFRSLAATPSMMAAIVSWSSCRMVSLPAVSSSVVIALTKRTNRDEGEDYTVLTRRRSKLPALLTAGEVRTARVMGSDTHAQVSPL